MAIMSYKVNIIGVQPLGTKPRVGEPQHFAGGAKGIVIYGFKKNLMDHQNLQEDFSYFLDEVSLSGPFGGTRMTFSRSTITEPGAPPFTFLTYLASVYITGARVSDLSLE
jgi:hypothetical protein